MDESKLSDILLRLWRVLKDGELHTDAEMLAAIDPENPELCSSKNKRNHLGRLRQKLPDGMTIVKIQVKGCSMRWRLVRLLNNPYDGKS